MAKRQSHPLGHILEADGDFGFTELATQDTGQTGYVGPGGRDRVIAAPTCDGQGGRVASTSWLFDCWRRDWSCPIFEVSSSRLRGDRGAAIDRR